MTKPVIVTRIGKGSELTFQEGDDNFTNLRDATINISADSGSTQIVELNGTLQIAGGTGVSTAADNGVVTISGFDGDYSSLSNTPTLFDGDYNSLSNTPSLATVATSGSYTDLSDKPTIPTNNTELTNGAGYITGIDSSAVTTALGFTPENSANKNANNGYAGLDANGLVPASLLPSYVDDVLEFADLATFPSTGETGKIFVAADTGKIYRWSGSAYVEISASPGSTDAVTEGATNLYFTQQRARDSVSAGTGISYDPSTGVITSTATSGIESVQQDTAPTLGGNLVTNGWQITGGPGNNVVINPDSGQEVFLLKSLNMFSGSGIKSANNQNLPITSLGSGRVIVSRLAYEEAVHSLGTTSGTIAPNAALGNVQTITLNGNLTLNAFTSPVVGQSITLIVNTGGTGRTLTSTMKWAGGEKTLSTTNTTDIITVFYDGTNYWASLGKDFK